VPRKRAPRVQSGAFRILDRVLVPSDPARDGEKRARGRRAPGGPQTPFAPALFADLDDTAIVPADQVVTDDLIVQGFACVGVDCADGEILFSGGPFKVKGFAPWIKLEDTDGGAFATHDWLIRGNDGANSEEFSINDLDAGTVPFRILGSAPTNALVVDALGNVGLGTATPSGDLHIYGAATQDVFSGIGPDPAAGPAFNFGYAGSSFGRGAGFFNVRPDAQAAAPNPSLRFATANVQRMIITNSGNVGIGTTAPTNPLQMASGARVTAGGVWTDASSREVKQDIDRLTPDEARAALAGLDPVKFAYRADPAERHVGFVAEDVPTLVATADRKGLSPMDIVAVLTRVVQEQQQAIAELRAEMAVLRRAARR
jgi:hypothetical protein